MKTAALMLFGRASAQVVPQGIPQSPFHVKQTPAAQPFKSLLTLPLNMPLNWSTFCLFIDLHKADAVLPDLMFPSES